MTDEPRNDRFDAEGLLASVAARFERGGGVRRTLPGGGRLHVDRPLPFLVVHRRPAGRDDAGTAQLVLGQPAYLVWRAIDTTPAELQAFLAGVIGPLTKQFGAFLVIEVWSSTEPAAAVADETAAALTTAEWGPRFRVVTPDQQGELKAVDALVEGLRTVALNHVTARVEHVESRSAAPAGTEPVVDPGEANRLDCYIVGLEVDPVYREAAAGRIYPDVLRDLARQTGDALRRAFFRFAHDRTQLRPASYLGMGRRAIVKAVHEVDDELAAICDAFDFLLAVTPVNTVEAWETFRSSGFAEEPTFRYRRIAHDPEKLLRRLYAVPLENMEDPALERIFREKVREVARQLTMLAERNTHRFLYGSLQLYGEVEDSLLRLAEGILAGVGEDDQDGGQPVDAQGFAALARSFLDEMRARHEPLSATIEIRGDTAGLMVSKGRLLVPVDLRLSPARAKALAYHEVGTHILTWVNGTAQPLALMYNGLAGYEALQEGLAVLGEYLVGGLSRSRLRLLAARVVAARAIIDGASFCDMFHQLTATHGMPAASAFSVAMRALRGGGLTKDVIYLRGLKQLLDYLAHDGDFEILFTGKMALRHVPLVKDLREREVLRPPPLQSTALAVAGARSRLEWLREGRSVLDLPETVNA